MKRLILLLLLLIPFLGVFADNPNDIQAVQLNSPALQQEIQPVQQNSPALQQDIQPLQLNSSTPQQDIQPLQLNSPAPQQDIQPLQLNSPALQQEIQPVQQNSPAPQQDIQPLQLNSPAPQQETQPVQRNSPAVQQEIQTVQQDTLIVTVATGDSSAAATAGTAALVSGGSVIDTTLSAGMSLQSVLRGLLGMAVILIVAWVFSKSRKGISWRVVLVGLSIQVVLAVGILYIPFVRFFFEFVGKIFVKILDFTKEGSTFLFGNLMDMDSFGMIFAFQILPTIIFFSALTSLLFYLGIIQKVVYALAWVMTKALRISGAESLSVAGNIFLGQTESPLMVKAYLPKMNPSEIMLVMTGGMATLAGGVLAAYIGFLGGDDPVQRLIFAKHLLAASVMAAPGAVVISKMLVPQVDEISSNIEITREKVGSNILDAISNGTTEGLKLAANVAAMLLTFIAFIAFINYIFLKLGQWTNLNQVISDITGGNFDRLSLQFILGYTFAPVMWLIGVAVEDITLLGRLLGEKVIMTEFVGYISLAELKDAGAFAHNKSIIMATYMLAGFANFASIGIQIGGIGSLAPNQRVLLSKFGLRALLAGTLASLMSATIIGAILG